MVTTPSPFTSGSLVPQPAIRARMSSTPTNPSALTSSGQGGVVCSRTTPSPPGEAIAPRSPSTASCEATTPVGTSATIA